jgi:hypothetical protein
MISLALLLAASASPDSGALSVVLPVAVEVDDFDTLKQQLRDQDRYERHKAVKGLAQLGTEEAWMLVIESLADPMGRVSDQAQLDLERLPEALVSELMGKRGLGSRKEIVALRAAEIFGRLEYAAQDKGLISGLKHKDADVRRSLLWSIERLALRSLLTAEKTSLAEEVSRLSERDKSDLVKAQALVTLGALGAESLEPAVLEFIAAGSTPLRIAAVELLDLLEGEAAVLALQLALADNAPVVRLRAHEFLAGRGDRESLRRLIEALESEPVLRSRWRLVALLRELSGLKHGLDPRPWKRWVGELPEDWTPADKHVAEELGGDKTVSFVGMPMLSERVAFLIDFSGSMYEEKGNTTRKQRVDVELRRALESLDETVSFNLHPFHDAPMRWQKKLTPAKKRSVAKALDWFEGLNDQGRGDFWAAAMEAMADPEVDTLMVLTDGAPTGGRRWSLDLMRELFQHENRFRGVALDALLFDASKGLTFYWTDLCTRTGGRCQNVDI